MAAFFNSLPGLGFGNYVLQTQVATVIPYFKKFIKTFPSVSRLAASELDFVLSHWSGLGYYARARNLHAAAQIITQQYKGRFPQDPEQLQKLPGIGQSTAHAILALACDLPLPILDGNVKRVLTRHFAIEGWPERTEVKKKLWAIAEEIMPSKQAKEYTQGMMDLGALVCTSREPNCLACPLIATCQGYKTGRVKELPSPKLKKIITQRQQCFLVLSDNTGRILLERRPPTGIWGGLWSLPEFQGEEETMADWCLRHYGCEVSAIEALPALKHLFSHFQLTLLPQHCTVAKKKARQVMENERAWYTPEQWRELGLAKPIRTILERVGRKNEKSAV